MDAAERSILSRGFRASTMEIIAREAGYSRAAIYRHFPSRQHLLKALVARKTAKHQSEIGARLSQYSGAADILVESLVIVATELIHDPLLMTLSEQTDEGTVAHMVASDEHLPELVGALIEAMRDGAPGQRVRAGLNSADAGRFIITTALTLLLRVIPDIDDPDTARRYLQTFMLPAILEEPPPPSTIVFPA